MFVVVVLIWMIYRCIMMIYCHIDVDRPINSERQKASVCIDRINRSMKQIESTKLTRIDNIVTANVLMKLTINITLPVCEPLHAALPYVCEGSIMAHVKNC